MSNVNAYIQRCFDLARLGTGSTSPNPSVGAVIVDPQGHIIGEGWTSPYGGAHAEVNAVRSVKFSERHLLTSCTLYVSLEPCNHFGKTPPCSDLILHEKIPHVVIAYIDPFPQVAGKSVEKLRQQGVQVDIVQTQNSNNKYTTLFPFFVNVSTKRPYIILKWAETFSGFIGKENETVAISNAVAKRLVHKWRSESDAIMVGTNTAVIDNPELNNRFYYGKSPIRVVVDKKNILPAHTKLLDGTTKTLVYTEEALESVNNNNNLVYRRIDFNEKALEHILDDLYSQDIGILFVEGGSTLLQSFIEKGIWNEARVFKTQTEPIENNGIRAPQIPFKYLERKLQILDNQLFVFRNI